MGSVCTKLQDDRANSGIIDICAQVSPDVNVSATVLASICFQVLLARH
jgi:hypothetical protein